MAGTSAELVLRCTGAGACGGTIEVVTRIVRERWVTRAGRRSAVKRSRKLTIGSARFSLAPSAAERLAVQLSAAGQTLLAKSGRRGLSVELTGSGVKSGAVIIL